jgi:hypothetical protein
MKEHNVGLKVLADSVPVGLIRIIKKYRTGSLGAIKDDILKGRFVLTCSYSGDFENFQKIIRCHDDLINAGYKAELYEHGRKSTISFFKNWSKSMADTRRQTKETWDDLLEDD